MTSNLPTSPNYCQLDENTSENKNAKRQFIFFLILTLVLSTETFITAFLLYDFCEDIHRTRETGRDGGYPIHCLSTDVTQPTDQAGIASCDLFNQELTQTARQRLLLDIQNYVLGTFRDVFTPACDLGGVFSLMSECASSNHSPFSQPALAKEIIKLECGCLWSTSDRSWFLLGMALAQSLKTRLALKHNITEIFKPAVHVGAKQELKQYQRLQKNADEAPALDRIQWDNMNGQFSQEGLMSLSPEGEILVPHDGIYFVFSQVYFETQLGRSMHFTQYLYKKTASYPRPVMLAKAVATPCVSVRSGVQLYSNHQGALFRLEKGDRLSLYVLNISDVRFPQEATYFGAFMIN